MYQKLERLKELQKELKRIKENKVGGAGLIDILERLITEIVVLKMELGIKITI
jgi:hypothetical protein